jgi:uncharacterized protein YecE (DUF72 family)
MLPLFDEAPQFNRDATAAKLKQLAAQGVWIGTSSWKYEGWCGQVYTHQKYMTRGRFARKRFESECLAEYAETFPIVCGDFTFYQFPPAEYWKRLFGSAGPNLKFAFKVPEEITAKEFPSHPRYGPRRGALNETFLDADLLRASFLDPLAPYLPRIASLIFEFGAFSKRCYEDVGRFIADLDPFLSKLPREFRYSVEVRNADYLMPIYFDCLRHHGVAHVFNAWTRMPELSRQIVIRDAYTADFTLTRALLRRGRDYEEAVERFSPYNRIQDENPDARQAMRELIRKAKEQRRTAYIFVNNRLEGNAPQTIEAVLADL